MEYKLLNKTARYISINKKNSFFLLILTTILFDISCKNNENKINDKSRSAYETKIKDNSIIKDSLTINILVQANQFLLLNIRNKYLQNDALYFKNPSNKDSIITKTIFREYNKQVLRFGMVVMNKGKIQNHFTHFYLIDKKCNNLNFVLKKNKDLKLLDKNTSIIVDEVHKKYDSLKLFLSKTENKDTLNQVYLYFKEKYEKEDKTTFAELNDVLYLSLLSINDKEVNHYIENIEKPIVSNALNNLFYSYIRENILKFDYSILNDNYKTKEFLRYLSISMFNYLKNEGNKGDDRYIEAIKWLKTTSFYNENSVSIDKELFPIDKEEFKKKIKKLKFLDPSSKVSSISEIMFKASSKYYLIDFWATWCAPCIGGVRYMNKMDFPRDVKVISISLDKVKDIEKWKDKTKELQQQYTYWLDVSSIEGKSFLKFIELQSIPRYILIDEDLNLIDQAFLHPNEPDFLPRLKDVNNSKYW